MPVDKSSALYSSKNRKKRASDSDEEQEEKVEVPDPSDPASGDEGGSADEEEYEIEEILKAERGRFGDGQLGYFVKWKGFDASENSWVSAQDAENAKELIDAFWAKQKKKTKGAVPSARTTTKSSTKPRRSPSPTADKDEGEDELPESVSAPAPKKRGRPPKQKSASPEENVMDVDEEEEAPVPKKKPRKEVKETKSSSSAPSKKTKPPPAKKSKHEEPSSDDEGDPYVGNMDAYANQKSWEDLVERIDTVERTEDNELFVYFTLKSKYDGLRVKEKSELCKKKFPQKMLSFYEANLKWRSAN